MKLFRTLTFAIFMAIISFSCSSQNNNQQKSEEQVKADKTEVIYFHFTRRCATCQAVEKVAKEAIKELKSNNVSFADYNLDDDAGKLKGKEMNVSGQTLLIVAGNQKIDITNEGFMNARTNPDKLKEIIQDKLKSVLKD